MSHLRARKPRIELTDRIQAVDPIRGLCALSAVTLVFAARDDPWVMVPVAVALPLILPSERVLTSPYLWGVLFLSIGVRQVMTWHTLDDHTIAMTYWCGALALGLGASRPQQTLAYSARLLIGLIFAFAASWKLFSGEFADGTFFRYSLLFDDRFQTVAELVGGTSPTVRDDNVAAVSTMLAGRTAGTVLLAEGPRNAAIASVFTGWGIFIETAVAVTFLMPLRSQLAWVRHAALVGFAATTYAVVPIGGFGTFLLVLGSATVTSWRSRWAYYLGAGVLALWGGLWPLIFE